MIVPGSPSANPAGPTQDNQPKPSPALLLMAAAEMQRMGRLQSEDSQQAKGGHGGFYSPPGVEGRGWLNAEDRAALLRWQGNTKPKGLNTETVK